jgi:hypothetical protein
MGRYAEKLAEKNKLDYTKVKRIYLGDSNTYLESAGQDKWQIKTPNSVFRITEKGIYISGNVEIDSPVTVNQDFECKKKISAKEMSDKSKEGL